MAKKWTGVIILKAGITAPNRESADRILKKIGRMSAGLGASSNAAFGSVVRRRCAHLMLVRKAKPLPKKQYVASTEIYPLDE